jgi:hypothetical protein
LQQDTAGLTWYQRGREHGSMRLRHIVGISLLLAPLGCHTVRPVQPQFIPREQPEKVWVTRVEGGQVEVDDPLVEDDTLRGLTGSAQKPVAIALTDVKAVRASTPDVMKTVLVFGVPLGAIVGYWMYEIMTPESPKAVKAPECGFDPDGQPYPYC